MCGLYHELKRLCKLFFEKDYDLLDFLPEQAYNQFHHEQAFNSKARTRYLSISRGDVDPFGCENDGRLKEHGGEAS